MTRSLYADRDTVGTIALNALQCRDNPIAGDLGHELMPSLVEDLNNAIESNPYNNRPFYIVVHEKKDAQLKNVILRRIITTEKRPYPEPCTSVFHTDPKKQETLFCWSLPHWSVFPNYLLNPDHYVQEQVEDVKAYESEDLRHFGFVRIGWTPDKKPIIIPIQGFKDRELVNRRKVKIFI